MDFTYEASPARVVFAPGARRKVADELDRLGIARAMVITTPPKADVAAEFARLIGERAAIVYPGAQMHTPTAVTEAALTAVSSVQADGLLAIGGGSAIGLSKAIALRTDLPQLVLPTTFAGSEMTAILGETERGVKNTRTDPRIRPETIIYDPELLVTLPPRIAGPSAMNAIAHSVEALYAPRANPLTSLMAEDSIRALASAIPCIMAGPDDIGAWSDALYGAWLASSCAGTVGVALHHKICHTLGGMFDLDHADIHCVMLPYTAAFNRDAAPQAMARVARALGGEDAPQALYELMRGTASSPSLREMGLSRAALEKAADLAAKNAYDNPRPVTRDDILAILVAAHEGARP